MGKGKTANKSESVYRDVKNKKVRNVKYVKHEKNGTKETAKGQKTEVEDKKGTVSASLFLENFKNSTKRVLLTRDPDTISRIQARTNFYNLVNDYERENNVSLVNLSKNELMFRLLNHLEETETLVSLNDNSKQFLPYKISVPNIVKLYFYKLFYSNIFDFEIILNDNAIDLHFKSTYINDNFDEIYHQIENLIICLWYDGLLIAIKDLCCEIILSIKKSVEPTINIGDTIENLVDLINEDTGNFSDMRIKLLSSFTQSVIFMGKFHLNFYGTQEDKDHKLTSLLKGKTAYKGKRAFESRTALENAYSICEELLLENSKPFTRLLNIYYINCKSNIFDFDIITKNRDFASYAIDGIVTKYHINDMIISNSGDICSTTKSSSPLALSSVYNNPNCIVNNITSRDYEMLNYLIMVASNSARLYYLNKYGKDVSSQSILDLIECIDICKYTSKKSDIVFPAPEININSVDYEKVTYYNNPV